MRLVNDALAGMIAQAIEEQHLSIREAAARCEMGLGLMTNILYGRTQRPRPESLQAIAHGLGLSYSELALAAYGIVPTSQPVPA